MNRHPRAASSHARAAVAQPLEPRRMLSAFLLKDVNTAPPFEQYPAPAGFVEVNGRLLFGAYDGPDRVLYGSDGTPAGTAPLKAVRPEVNISTGVGPLAIGNVAFFAGTTSDGGTELWKSDGTAAGTVRVKDIYPGTLSSTPAHFADVNGTLYFTAIHPDYGRELWKSDGTEAGTVLVSDTLPGPAGRDTWEIEAAQGAVFFATIGSVGAPGVLWKTDGTPAGTVRLGDVVAAAYPPRHLEALGGSVVFNGFDLAHGQEPWISDGTPGGTRMLKDVYPFGGSSDNSQSLDNFRFGDAVYFSAYDVDHGAELWKTDGTTDGTVLVKDLLPGFGGSDPRNFVALNGTMYFLTGGPTGSELWRSDGTEAGTTLVKNGVNASRLIVSGSSLYFAGPSEVWKSDGTTAGTVLLRQLQKYPYDLSPFRGGVAFQGDDGPRWEPYVSDGTPAGTVMLGDFDRRTVGSVQPGIFPAAVSLGDKVVFVANAGNAGSSVGQLWVTDGTTAGTNRLSDAFGVAYLTRVGDVAYFFAAGFQQDVRRLWRTDGTPEGTRPVSDQLFIHGQPAVVGNALYFGARAFTPGTVQPAALYRSDGTAAGTTRVAALPAGSGIPSNITPAGGAIYFTHSINTSTLALSKSDGTEAGTVQVRQFPVTGTITGLTDVNGKLFFFTFPTGGGPSSQLWVSDGTPNGTVSLGTFAGQGPSGESVTIAAFNGAAYFAASAPAKPGDVELWKSDGTPGGTTRAIDVRPGDAGSYPRTLTVFNGRLYFSADDGRIGRELWSTDGTQAGTSPVLDLFPGPVAGLPGPGGTLPSLWGQINGRLYFTGIDGVHGFAILSTDGTAAGTTTVADVTPDGPGSGLPPLAPVGLSNATAGDRVIFWADDGVHGMEPWSAPLPGTPTNDFVLGRHLFYNNSRFDGGTPGAARADDGAIAPDKAPYVPADGGTPGFDNVSGYARGLNGLMIDVNTRLPGSADVVMKFDVGTGAANSPWTAAPTPLSVTRRNDGLPEDLDRITVIWPDGAIRNTWLRVTLEAMLDGAVVGRDVFYFGHLAGETGDAAAAGAVARVTASDLARTRAAVPTRGAGPANPFDHNRDGVVNVLDVNVVRSNLFATLPAPTAGATASPAARKPSARYRPGAWAGLFQ